MALVGMWLRLELRRRWRSLLVLALLVAVSAGVVLTAAAGARRGESAVDRLLDRTLPATIALAPNERGFDWDAVRSLPGVAAISEFGVTWAEVGGVEQLLQYDTAADVVERPVALQGRLPGPDGADEAVVTPGFVRAFGLGVGDTVPVRLQDPVVADAAVPEVIPPTPTGPVVPTRIVGVVRGFWVGERPGDTPALHPSTAWVERYRANLVGATRPAYHNALVRLDGGAAAIPDFQRDFVARTGRTDVNYIDLTAQHAKLRTTTAFESACLLAFGLAALAAAMVLVGQAIVRYSAAAVADLAVLRALGMTRSAALLAAVTGPAVAGLLGVGLGAGGAVLASARFPFGTAAEFEPAPGLDVDGVVLGVGSAAAVLLVLGGAAASAWRPRSARLGTSAPRRSMVAAAAARLGLPVPVLVGTRFALEPGRGRSALAVRPALVGAITGVLGVLAALTFSEGVSEAAGNPDRFGQTHRLQLFLGQSSQDYGLPVDPVRAAVVADPDVRGGLDVRDGIVDARRTDGDGPATPVSFFTTAPADGPEFPTVLEAGRLPQRPGEVTLAPATATTLGVGIGDTITATGTSGTGSLTVTGIGFVPYGPHNTYDDGAWLTPDGYDALVDGFKFHILLVALRPGADPAAVADRLGTATGTALGSSEPVPFEVVTPPFEATLLRNVEVLPVVLGGFLALLAVGAVGHALATAVRRRRHDMAVLRALGMTRGQARGVVLTQATVLAGVGLIVGIPLGLAVGRVLWRVVADITPLQYAAPLALLALLLAVPVTVLVANALAAWPGRQAARLRIGHVLRAE